MCVLIQKKKKASPRFYSIPRASTFRYHDQKFLPKTAVLEYRYRGSPNKNMYSKIPRPPEAPSSVQITASTKSCRYYLSLLVKEVFLIANFFRGELSCFTGDVLILSEFYIVILKWLHSKTHTHTSEHPLPVLRPDFEFRNFM